MENGVTVLIDGNSVVYRAFYKAPPLRAGDIPTGVIHVFLMVLDRLCNNPSVSDVRVIFDAKGKNYRHDIYNAYKETRSAMPEDLIVQLEVLKEILLVSGLPLYCVDGYEADDVIYTLSRDIKGTVWIVTKDKDLHQLINDRIFIFDYQKDELTDREGVFAKFGLYPEKIADMLALSGDSSDNVPGIAGVGPKTACSLLNEYGSLDGVFDNIRYIKGKLKEKIENARDIAYLSRRLVELAYIDNLQNTPPAKDEEKLRAFYVKYGLKQHLAKLDLKDKSVNDDKETPRASFRYGEVAQPVITAFTGGKVYDICGGFYAEHRGGAPEYYYDIKSLIKHGVHVPDNAIDLLLVGWLTDPDFGGVKIAKTESEGEFFARLFSVKDELVNKLKSLNLEKLYYDMELPVAFILAEMELKGILIDEGKLKHVADELSKYIKEEQGKITASAGYDLNPNSPKQLGEYLYDNLGLKGARKNKSGYSTDEDTLRDLLAEYPEHDDFLSSVLKYRELNKLYSTYTLNLLEYRKDDGRIHSDFKQTGTATGRLSSANPNMQNIPQKGEWAGILRQSFIAPEGYSFVSLDYSQIELRILAHMSQDDNLIAAFKDNRDIHTMTAKSIFHIARDEDVTSRIRRIAKAVNFGILYGLSSFGLSRDTKVSRKEAASFIDSYFALYPKVKEFTDNIIAETGEKFYAETVLGRKRFIKDILSRNANIRMRAERMAVNAPIQGSAADIIKLAMIACDKYIKEKGIDASSVLQIHDELIFEVKDESADMFLKEMKYIMENVISLRVPLIVNGETGKTWSDL